MTVMKRKRRAAIFLKNEHRRIHPNLDKVTEALERAARSMNFKGRCVEAVLVDDPAIAALAGRYRNSPHPTDVLAFPYDGAEEMAGGIAISLDTALAQAQERGLSIGLELVLLGIHGLLHVAGQGDETPRDWREMRIKEFEILARVL